MTPDSSDGRLVVPVGQDLGPRPGADGAPARRVRIGGRVVDLAAERYAVWLLAHGTPQAMDTATPWRRRSAVAAAGLVGIRDADDEVDALLADDLIVEVDPDAAEAFARAHRLVPTVLGLGNTADDPMLFGLGFLGSAVVRVDRPTYDLWSWAATEDTLWGTCASAADVARRAGGALHLDADKLLTDLLHALHPLLMSQTAYVDVAVRLGHPG